MVRIDTRQRLTEIPHQTDKAEYLPHYERHLAKWRDEPIVLFELGVDKGASLELWRAYLSRASIVGLDEKPLTLDDKSGRIKLYRGRQEDLDLLERIAREQAPAGFDVIIDDASHIAASTRASFWFLFERHLKPGGIYAIEDWGTGYWHDWPDGRAFEPHHSHGMVGFIKDLVDHVGLRDATDEVHGTPPERASQLSRLEIHAGLAIVVKDDGLRSR
jgi:SAM-dependent methyltransferase